MPKSITVILIIVALAIIAFGAHYIITANNTSELNEASPLDQSAVIDDTLDTMDDAKRTEFDAAVTEMEDQTTTGSDTMPNTPQVIAQGSFQPRAHEVAGNAVLIKHGDQATLRFEDFETINGPRLKIYLSSDLGISDSIDLGDIRATNGNINYPVDPTIDFTRYNKVLVWCEPFSVLFSYSELQ